MADEQEKSPSFLDRCIAAVERQQQGIPMTPEDATLLDAYSTLVESNRKARGNG